MSDSQRVIDDLYLNLKTTHNFILGPNDTDSISIGKEDGSSFSKEEQDSLLAEINGMLPHYIRYAHDGIYSRVIILRAKNYILMDESGKVTKKGSSLKSSKLEPALKEFMSEVIDCLLYDKQDQLLSVYNKYIKQVHNITDISKWCSKRTVTQSVLNPTRTNEQKVLDAIGNTRVQAGDKLLMYFKVDKSLGLVYNWQNDHDKVHLMKRIYNTLQVFANVIDMTQFPKYHLKNKLVQKTLQDVLSNDI